MAIKKIAYLSQNNFTINTNSYNSMSMEQHKATLFATIDQKLKDEGSSIDKQDQTRPCGGFFVINEDQAQKFADTYFDRLSVDKLKIYGKLSPILLVVVPEKR